MQPACTFPVTSPGTASNLASDKKNQGNYRGFFRNPHASE